MANFLREWRKFSGKTLVEVAKILGTTHTTILRYERSEMKIPAEMVNALADLEQNPISRAHIRRRRSSWTPPITLGCL